MTDYPRVRGQVRGKKGIPVRQEDFPGDGGGQLGERMGAPPARSRSRTSCSAPGVAVPVHSLSAGWLEVHSGSRVATGSPQSVEKVSYRLKRPSNSPPQARITPLVLS